MPLDSTSWMDALPAVTLPGQAPPAPAPTTSAPAPDAKPTTTPGDDIPTVTVTAKGPQAAPSDTSWMDALPAVTLPKDQPKAAAPPQPLMTAADVPSVLAGSTAAALDALPRGLVGNSTVNYVDAATQTPLRMLYGKLPQQPGDTSPPQNGFRLAGPLTAFNEGLQNAETQHNALSDKYPVASIGGELMGGAAGGAMAAPALAWEAAPAAAGILPKLANAGSYIARNAAFGGTMGALSGEDPAQGAVLGGAVGALAPAFHVLGSGIKGAYNAVKPLWSQGAREASVGNVLNRTVGASPIETSQVGPLDLGAATNNANVAAKADIAPGYNAGADAALRQGQQAAVTNQISSLGAPASAADASTAFTGALRQGRALAGTEEGRLWTVPKLAELPVTPAPVQSSVNGVVQAMDPVLRDSMPAQLRALVNRLNNSKNTTVRDLNGIRSDLEKVARTSNDGAERSMARSLSDAFMDGMDRVPEIAGAPNGVPTGRMTLARDANGILRPAPEISPPIAADPEITAAYQTARNYTRQMRTMFGAQDPAALLARNGAGVPRVDASEGARRFFNFSNGSPEGPHSIAQISDFIATLKAQPGSGAVADQLRGSARSYIAAALTDAARVNPGENLNPKLMQDFLRKNGDWMRSSGLFSGPQIKAADDLMGYAEMLRRPGELLRQVNSATQPRAVRDKTFIDQIMAPWMRHAATVGATIAGGAHGAIEAGVGSLAGMGLGHAVTHAEAAMREMMAQALLDPRVAQDLMMKASAGNRMLMSPGARQIVDTMRAALGADMAPQLIGVLGSPAASEMGR